MKKFLTIFAVAALALLTVASCKDKEDEETTVDLKAISLSSPSLDLFVGDESTLTVKYTPENATNKPAATWTSSNESVASVSEGKVTALAAGEATITATVEKFTATCTVKVSEKDSYTGPVQGNSAWSVVGTLLGTNWDKDFVCAESDGIFVLKNVRLQTTEQFKFRKDNKWDDNRGAAGGVEPFVVTVGEAFEAVAGGKNLSVAENGLYDLYYNANVEQIAVVALDGTPTWAEPQSQAPVVIDGDASEWGRLNAADVVSLTLPDGAAKAGLKSAKAYYDDKFYLALELSDEAIATGKVRFHIYFDTDNTGALAQHWDKNTIDYMSEGKVFDGAYCAYSSSLYKWAGTADNPWAWESTGVKPVFEGTGAGNTYELSMEYGDYPGGLPVAFNFGLDVADGDYAVIGFLPASAEGATKLARIVKVGETDPGEKPEEPVVDWDYTPSAEYTADSNIWKALDQTMNISWFYKPEWAAEQAGPEVTFKESTYYFWNKINTTGDWQAQLWLEPASDLILNAEKKYSFSCKVYATEETPVFIKMYHRGEDGSKSFEIARTRIAKGVITEFKAEDFTPLISSQCLLIDFGGVPANTKVFIKDIVLTEGDAVTPPQPMEWDYTPGAAYLADNNLWKKVAGHEGYYYYHCTGADWNGTDTISSEVPFLTTNQSTYELTYEDATANPWQNQLFIFPDTGYEVALAADKTYKLTMTVAANADMNGFFKLSKFDPNNATKREGATIWEKGNVSMKAKEIFTVESPELTGVECDNILIVTDFGGNPAGAKIFIKDITLVEVGAEPQAPATIAEIIKNIPAEATGSSTAVEFEANLTSPAVVSYVNGKNAYIQDATGAILLYLSDHGLVAGDTIKGKIAIKAYWYNGIPETVVALGDACEIAHGDAPAPKEMTIAQLLADYDANLLRLVKLTNVTVTDGIADGDRNGALEADGSTIAVYAQINNGGLVLTEGAKGDFVTIPAYYKTTKQVYLWDNAWFIKAAVGSTGEDLGGSEDVNPWN